MPRVPAITRAVIGAACVPTTPLNACRDEFAPAVMFMPEPAALKTDPPLDITVTPAPVCKDPKDIRSCGIGDGAGVAGGRGGGRHGEWRRWAQ